MTDPVQPHADDAQTTELAIGGSAGQGPLSPNELIEQLPGLEPERQVTDWGRSERIEGLVDRTVYEFLYHYWFRVEVEGIENVPLADGALIVANHSGVLPSDSAMIAKALRDEHPRRRALHLVTEPRLAAVPALGMLLRKLGAVPEHPANIHRLLFDERQLVLAFPEGRQAIRKPLSERYRLRAFERSELLVAAIRAEVPIVPLAVLGAEEAMPVFAALRTVARVPDLPLTSPLPLPSKFKLRFLEPVGTAGARASVREERTLAEEVRALIQENLLELVAARRSVWLG
ncbi:MAG: 1-acyl-sn-glycerol-3-phosphate acyltransferase [Solirubrobacterales bacterium]|nr:1-acyl-sn-glycerol-3-phosphate acyltransferase [Solirubrobacterales bacterium]